jgi:hypothetical protein
LTARRPRGASAHLNVDVFVFATSSVSVVRLWLPMILLANLSTIERQMQIEVRLIRRRDSAPTSEVMAVLQATPVSIQDMDLFVYIYGKWV